MTEPTFSGAKRSHDSHARRMAYADPPYPGQAKRLYGSHPDYAGEVDHAQLIERLEREFPDGWALSTSTTALADVLQLCPKLPAAELRICAWIRGVRPFKPLRLMWTWEPLIVRTPHWRQRHPGDFIRDSVFAMQPVGFLGATITGQKPVPFCHWMFDCLGLEPYDELVDLFPGSGAVTKAWDAWCAQTRLAV